MSALPDDIWRKVLMRDDYKCLHCNAEEDLQPAHYEARSLAGSDDVENIMTLCSECHRKLHEGYLIVKKIAEHFFFREKKIIQKRYNRYKNNY